MGINTASRVVPSAEYRLGPGDFLEVQITGRIEVTRQQVVVDPEGVVNIPPVGAIPVIGLTLLEAQRKVTERARVLFRYVDLTIAMIAPRCFEITLSGEVERPGTLQISAIRRVHEAILAAGGITPRGSLRRVKLVKKTGDAEIDLLRFELRGELGQNPVVEEGMVVIVPPRAGTVMLTGAVRRPGEYEIGPGRTLSELMEITGGLAQASVPAEARLTRIGTDGRKETFSLDLPVVLAQPSDVPLRPGDVLYVPPLTILQDIIELRGAFNGTSESGRTTTAGKPTIVQRFELAQGDRVRDVIVRAGGPAAFADLRQAFIERAGSGGPRQRVPVDLHRLLVERDEAQDILLENGDVLTLPILEDKIYIVGEVKNPGPHDYRSDLTPREYVAMAGGPTVRAKIRNTSVTFRNGRTFAMAEAPPLEPGAVVTVPEVAVRWYQDYLTIASTIAGLVTGYASLFVLLTQ